MPRGVQVTHLSREEVAAADSPVLGRIASLLRPYRRQLVLVCVAVVAGAALTSVIPFLTRAVFDQALFPNKS